MGDNFCGDGKGGDVGDRQGDAESSVDGLIPTGGVTRRIFWPFFLSGDAVCPCLPFLPFIGTFSLPACTIIIICTYMYNDVQ